MLYTCENARQFGPEYRKWQGIPGIERTAKGRLFAVWYSGNVGERLGNFCPLAQSDDDGQTWTDPVAAAYAGEQARAYDPCIWIDPQGRLWFFWSVMSPKLDNAVYAAVCDDPDADTLEWGEARYIGAEVMMNKPTVLRNGDWLLPVAVWRDGVTVTVQLDKGCVTQAAQRLSFVYRSRDNGETFERLGGADVPERGFDEHMVVEKNDGTLWMLVRTGYGIGQAFSRDGGATWEGEGDSGLGGPCSRFHIRRLQSGNLLLINHVNFDGRNNLTALLSRDDGASWEGGLLLDGRRPVSYPDAVQAPDGTIYAIYDRERSGAKEILMAKFTEEDILAGKHVSELGQRMKMVTKLGEYSPRDPGFLRPANLMNDAPAAGLHYAREPVLRRMPDGSLFCVFLTGGTGEPQNENYAAATRSFDDGETWTKLAPLFKHSKRGVWATELFTGGEQPCLFVHTYNAETGYYEIKAHRSFSTDGAAWSDPVSVPGGHSNVSVRQGIALSNGDWLFPVYWQVSGNTWEMTLETFNATKHFHSGALISDNQGENFQLCGDLRPGGEPAVPLNRLWEPNCVEAEPGHVIMLMRASGTGFLYRSDSFDYGRTWTSPAATDIPSPGTKLSLAKIGDRIVLAHNPNPTDGWDYRTDLSVWVSDDSMETWKTKIPLVAPGVRMFYPHMFADDEKQTLYLACENARQSYLLKIPYADIIS